MLDAFTRSIPDNGGDKFTLAADRSVNHAEKPAPQADRPAGRSHHMQATGDRRICVGSLRQPTLVEDK